MERLGRQLVFTAKASRASLDRLLAETGSSLPQFVLLGRIHAHIGLSQRDLGRLAGLEGSTITHHLDKLEADGLITRTRDPKDRRVLRLALTAAGEELFLRVDSVADDHDARLQGALGPRDAAALRRILTKLQRHHDEEG